MKLFRMQCSIRIKSGAYLNKKKFKIMVSSWNRSTYRVEKVYVTPIFFTLYAGPRLEIQLPDLGPLIFMSHFRFYRHTSLSFSDFSKKVVPHHHGIVIQAIVPSTVDLEFFVITAAAKNIKAITRKAFNYGAAVVILLDTFLLYFDSVRYDVYKNNDCS